MVVESLNWRWKIDPQKDKVKVNGQLLAQEKPVYYLLNKPKGLLHLCLTLKVVKLL